MLQGNNLSVLLSTALLAKEAEAQNIVSSHKAA